mmetsp:Transcript_21245/g.52287  ORF Transcript_21245/g.52287 Transcript_21245/m.52287 type:complete len:303 (+) Transcript_21245:3155-4063(+)
MIMRRACASVARAAWASSAPRAAAPSSAAVPATASALLQAPRVSRQSCHPRRLVLTPARSLSTQASGVKPVEKGDKETLEHRIFFEDAQGAISPWHDIPLFPARGNGLLNLVVEIPRGTRAKMEIAVKEEGNPILQDTKKGKLRYYGIDPVFNYGAFPQTWEDPDVKHADANCVGDGDPIDVVEIGSAVIASGSVVQVKPLGVLCMIDEGEADWKVIAIAKGDPLFDKVNDIEDVEKHMPGKVSEVREWFRTYKTHEGKPLNEFGLNEEAKGKDYTMKVILQGYADWARLRVGLTAPGKFKL